jgi:hypothetical protein
MQFAIIKLAPKLCRKGRLHVVPSRSNIAQNTPSHVSPGTHPFFTLSRVDQAVIAKRGGRRYYQESAVPPPTRRRQVNSTTPMAIDFVRSTEAQQQNVKFYRMIAPRKTMGGYWRDGAFALG